MWQLVNCLFTAGYSLYLRGTMDRVVALTASKTKLDEFSMVWYNNLLSLPLIAGLMWWCAASSDATGVDQTWLLRSSKTNMEHSNSRMLLCVFATCACTCTEPDCLIIGQRYGEMERLRYEPALHNPHFIFAACASALLAFGISFASLWCAHAHHAGRFAFGSDAKASTTRLTCSWPIAPIGRDSCPPSTCVSAGLCFCGPAHALPRKHVGLRRA